MSDRTVVAMFKPTNLLSKLISHCRSDCLCACQLSISCYLMYRNSRHFNKGPEMFCNLCFCVKWEKTLICLILRLEIIERYAMIMRRQKQKNKLNSVTER